MTQVGLELILLKKFLRNGQPHLFACQGRHISNQQSQRKKEERQNVSPVFHPCALPHLRLHYTSPTPPQPKSHQKIHPDSNICDNRERRPLQPANSHLLWDNALLPFTYMVSEPFFNMNQRVFSPRFFPTGSFLTRHPHSSTATTPGSKTTHTTTLALKSEFDPTHMLSTTV